MTITIDPSVKELLKAQATSLDVNMSNYISMLVQREEFYQTLLDERDADLAGKAERLKALQKKNKVKPYKGEKLAVFELEESFRDNVTQAVSKRAKAEKGKEIMKKVVEEAKAAEAQADQANDEPDVDTVDEPAENPTEERFEDTPTLEDVSDVITNSGKKKRSKKPMQMI